MTSFTFQVTKYESYKQGQLLASHTADFKIVCTLGINYIQVQFIGDYQFDITKKFELPISNDPFDPDEIIDRFVYGRLTPEILSPYSRIKDYYTPIIMERFKTQPIIRFLLPTLEQIEFYGFYE